MCQEHRQYKAIRPPRSTPKHPRGCVACWNMYNTKADQLKKPTLAVEIPTPRKLSNEKMSMATAEAREFGRSLDAAFDVMEHLSADDLKIVIR